MRGSAESRFPPGPGTGPVVVGAWVLGLTALFLGVSLRNLASYPPVSNDEVWIMSASYKLATRGVFGSDMYAGLFGADRHYFIALPVHHLLQALVFRLFDGGIVTARSVSLVSAITLVWVASWLAYRWHGPLAAVLTGILLVLWRSNFSAEPIPLLWVGRVGRYDASPLALAWLAIAALDETLRRPTGVKALLVGGLAAAATLCQFFGGFVVPVVMVAWVRSRGRRVLADPLSYCLAIGFLAVVLPYGIYVARSWANFAGQTTALKEARVRFDTIGFYVDNVRREPRRYAHLVHWPWPSSLERWPRVPPLGSWLLVLAVGPASIAWWVRARRGPPAAVGDRLLGLALVSAAGLLVLLDSTKAPLYAVALYPGLCILVATAGADLLRWAWMARRSRSGRFAIGAIVGLLAAVVVEGGNAYRQDLAQAASVSAYLDVGRRIDAALPPGAAVLGAERWWWPLRAHPYLSLNSLWLQWRLAGGEGGRVPEFRDWVACSGARYLVMSRDTAHPGSDALASQVRTFLDEATVAVADWTDATYGRFRLYRVTREGAPPAGCGDLPSAFGTGVP